MPTHAKYQAIRNNDERREYNRLAKATERARKRAQKPAGEAVSNVSNGVSLTVNDCQQCQPIQTQTQIQKQTHDPSSKISITKGESDSVGELFSGSGVTADDIFNAYPRKGQKPAAIKAIKRALETESPDRLLAATKAYSENCTRIGKEQRF